MKKILLPWAILFSCSVYLHAASADKAGSSAAVFLRDGQGAAALGMGGAFTAISKGSQSLFWNPGGMSLTGKADINASYNTLIEDIYTQSIGFVHPAAIAGMRSAVGISFVSMGMDSIDKRDVSGTKTGSSDARSMAYGAGYGLRIGDSVGVGLQIKGVREELDDDTGSAVAADMGVLFKKKEFSAGISLRNAGAKIKIGKKNNSLSRSLQAGIAYMPQTILNGAMRGLTVALDLEKPVDNDIKMRAGTEYILMRMVSLRAGYEQIRGLGAQAGYSFGIGLWTDFRSPAGMKFSRDTVERDEENAQYIMEVDYAYLLRDLFDDLHRITIGFKF